VVTVLAAGPTGRGFKPGRGDAFLRTRNDGHEKLVYILGMYSGRKIAESLGNVTVRGEKRWKSKRGARLSTVCLSMYSITENIYYSQMSSAAILLQPEPNCFTSYNTRK
jgi:hypothetical protein